MEQISKLLDEQPAHSFVEESNQPSKTVSKKEVEDLKDYIGERIDDYSNKITERVENTIVSIYEVSKQKEGYFECYMILSNCAYRRKKKKSKKKKREAEGEL
jgi:hypothetical protein